MIKSVVREFKWNPETIKNLYVDDVDSDGLKYWYKDVLEVNKEITKKK